MESGFSAPDAAVAPRIYLELMKKLHSHHNDVSEEQPEQRHRCYVSEELVTLCLFNEVVQAQRKRGILSAMIMVESDESDGDDEDPP